VNYQILAYGDKPPLKDPFIKFCPQSYLWNRWS